MGKGRRAKRMLTGRDTCLGEQVGRPPVTARERQVFRQVRSKQRQISGRQNLGRYCEKPQRWRKSLKNIPKSKFSMKKNYQEK